MSTWESVKRKLTSRKFWASLASFVTLMLTANGMSESEAARVAAIIMAGATVIAYIVGEGLVDAMSGSTQEGILTAYGGQDVPTPLGAESHDANGKFAARDPMVEEPEKPPEVPEDDLPDYENDGIF